MNQPDAVIGNRRLRDDIRPIFLTLIACLLFVLAIGELWTTLGLDTPSLVRPAAMGFVIGVIALGGRTRPPSRSLLIIGAGVALLALDAVLARVLS